MNWFIDKPVRIGPHVFAAIAEVELSIQSAGQTVIGAGKKRPILILHAHDDTVTGIDIAGNAYQPDEIERLYPKAIAQFAARLPVSAD